MFTDMVGYSEKVHQDEKCEKSYKAITELYPDDREGYHYFGLYFHYLEKDFERAIEQYDQAIELSPGYFPIYRDKVYALGELQRTEEAVALLQNYMREFADGPGTDYARQAIAQIRGI